MTGFLLDTNIPSELVRPQPEPKVKTWVAAQSLDTLFISSVSFGELRKGIFLRRRGSGGQSSKRGLKPIYRSCFPAAFCQSRDPLLSDGAF